MSRESEFQAVARELGYDFNGELQKGGNYTPWVRHAGQVYVSGQLPRVGTEIVVTGRVGADVTLERAQLAARICVMRALALLRQSPGGLDALRCVPRMTVYVQAANGYTQLSEVADGASALLWRVLGEAGTHTRTSVGVAQLPKNAAVELDLIAAQD